MQVKDVKANLLERQQEIRNRRNRMISDALAWGAWESVDAQTIGEMFASVMDQKGKPKEKEGVDKNIKSL